MSDNDGNDESKNVCQNRSGFFRKKNNISHENTSLATVSTNLTRKSKLNELL